ncbi:MAG: MmgE/PrpD family protein [Candidatus Binatia bacterium]|nr:MmgE/PrpD family protein [Candidatus Binatia bacterium]
MRVGVAEQVAKWVASLRIQDVPRRILEELKNQVLSCIAAIHAGHFSEAGRVVSRTVRQWSGGKEATLVPSGERTSLHFALYANAALSMALDYDDYLFAAHTGHSAVVGSLAVAETYNRPGAEVLLAQLVSNEIGGRLGAVALGGPFNGQMCTFVHLAGGAALAARLLELDSDKTQAALNIAVAQPPQPLRAAFFGSEAKAVLASQTLTIGVQAAQLAAQGMRVVSDVWGGEDGFAKLYAVHPLSEAFQNLGELWLSDTLSYKVYPGCAYLSAIIDCVLSLQRQHHIDGRKVRSVEIATNPLTLGMEAWSAPYLRGAESLPVTLNFSVAYSVAAALLDKELSPRQFLPERIKDPATWQLAARVRLSLDDGMTQKMQETALVRLDPSGRSPAGLRLEWGPRQLNTHKMSFGARVRIELDSGKVYEAEQEVPFGAFGRSFDDRRKQVEDKFRRETRYTLRKERMERAIDMIFHLEDLNAAQVRELLRMCCSERS